MHKSLAGSEKQKVTFSSPTFGYKIDDFPGAYSDYLASNSMENPGRVFAGWIIVILGVVIFLTGFAMHINGVYSVLGHHAQHAHRYLPEYTIVSGALMIFAGGRLRWWNVKRAEEFFVDNYQVVGEDGEALPFKVIVKYKGKGVFSLQKQPGVEQVSPD